VKRFILFVFIISISSLFAEDFYRDTLKIDSPIAETEMFKRYSKFSEIDTDPLKLKTVIGNGDISYFDTCYANDIQLGALSREELILLRNMIYAKYGYIFKDPLLIEYLKYFDWYSIGNDNNKIKISTREEYLLKRIESFEAPKNMDYPFNGKTTICQEFNGGADQAGAKLILNKDGTFIYEMSEVIRRVTEIKGNWKYDNKNLLLVLLEQNIIFGGYIHDHQNTPYIENGVNATVKYDKGIQVILPIQESKNYYNDNNQWIMIGSSSYIIES
jgi:hypothetical protein